MAMPMFSESSYAMGIVTLLYDLTGSGKLKMMAFKPEIPIHQLVDPLVSRKLSMMFDPKNICIAV